MSTPYHQVLPGLSLPSLLGLPRTRMDKDWYGTPVPWEVSWVAACSPEELLFGAVVEAPARCEEGAGFREGLWTHDVLELFVPCLRTTLHAARGEPRYLELNLAPSGAWWACLFEGYRIRCPRQPFPCEVRVWSTRREGSWSAALALPLAPIGISLDLPRLRFCAILGEPRRYLIHGISPGGTPDFHRQVLSTTE